MTRVQWVSVLALVTALSYGLMNTDQPVRGEQLEAAQAVVAPATAVSPTPPPATVAPAAVKPAATATLSLVATQAATSTALATPTEGPTAAPTDTLAPSPTATTVPLPTSTVPPTVAPLAEALPTPAPPLVNPHPEEPRFVFVDQYNQRLMIFEQGQLVRDIPCSSGLPESDKYTPTAQGRVGQYWGTFTSFGVEADEAWYLYKSSGSILIHSLPYTRDEQGAKLYQDRDALGVRPSSHGCIRIAPEDAAWLTAWNPEGALFEVTEPYLYKWLAPQ